MANDDIATHEGRLKRLGKFLWRWAPHVASLIATAALTVGAIILGSGDYDDLTKKTRIWGWSIVAGGLAFLIFATIANGVREHRRGQLRDKLTNAELRATNAENRADALQRALQEGLRSRLLHTRDDLGIANTEFRIGLYSHNQLARQLVRRARLSSHHAFEDPREGRTTIPDDNGLIGQALTTQKISVHTVATPRLPGNSRHAWENWMTSEGHLTQGEAAALRMETRHYMFAPIQDPTHGRTVGMLVIEFTTASGTPSKAKLRDSMGQRGRDLAVALIAVERELESSNPGQVGTSRDGTQL